MRSHYLNIVWCERIYHTCYLLLHKVVITAASQADLRPARLIFFDQIRGDHGVTLLAIEHISRVIIVTGVLNARRLLRGSICWCIHSLTSEQHKTSVTNFWVFPFFVFLIVSFLLWRFSWRWFKKMTCLFRDINVIILVHQMFFLVYHIMFYIFKRWLKKLDY